MIGNAVTVFVTNLVTETYGEILTKAMSSLSRFPTK